MPTKIATPPNLVLIGNQHWDRRSFHYAPLFPPQSLSPLGFDLVTYCPKMSGKGIHLSTSWLLRKVCRKILESLYSALRGVSWLRWDFIHFGSRSRLPRSNISSRWDIKQPRDQVEQATAIRSFGKSSMQVESISYISETFFDACRPVSCSQGWTSH